MEAMKTDNKVHVLWEGWSHLATENQNGVSQIDENYFWLNLLRIFHLQVHRTH